MYITNDPVLAKIIYDEGVKRIFIDWEVNGKQERQGHLDTVMSKHSYEDAVQVRKAVPYAELLIRINPFYENTSNEVEQALSAGANLIMLPMFHSFSEVKKFSEMVGDRAGIVPLFETPESLGFVEGVVQLPNIHEVYIGLNDLHLALGLDFMFEPLTQGLLENAAMITKKAGVRFGFGGVARANEGDVSGKMVLGEHVRLGSSSVILSRTFYRPNEDKESVATVFKRELGFLREAEKELMLRTHDEQGSDREKFNQAVMRIVNMKKVRRC